MTPHQEAPHFSSTAEPQSEILRDFSVAILSPGQGSQYVGMLKRHARESDAVGEFLGRVDQKLGIPLTQIMFDGPTDVLTRTEFAQPAIITSCVVSEMLLREQGKYPETAGFHGGSSLGLIDALRRAGCFDEMTAIQLARDRGLAFQYAIDNSPATTLIATRGLDEETLRGLEEQHGFYICNVNTPAETVIGGPLEKAELVRQDLLTRKDLQERGITDRNIRILAVNGAFHSPYMAQAVPLYAEALHRTPINRPTNGNVLGNRHNQALEEPNDIRQTLVEQVTKTDRFVDTVQTMKQRGVVATFDLGENTPISSIVLNTVGKDARRSPIDIEDPQDGGDEIRLGTWVHFSQAAA